MAWDKSMYHRHTGKFQLLGTQTAKGQVYNSVLGPGGKSSELSLTIVVKTGRAGLPPTRGGGSVSFPGHKERSSVLACRLLSVCCLLLRCVTLLVNCLPVPRAWAEPPDHRPDTRTIDFTRVPCNRCSAAPWCGESRCFPGRGAGQGTRSLTHERSREPDKSPFGQSLQVISSY